MTIITPSKNEIYTVSQLNHQVCLALENFFTTVWVQGELSSLAKPGSGHIYFVLKDNNALVKCALFRSRQVGIGCELKNGIKVLVQARVSLYERRGEYQLIIESLQPAGEGALQIAFEALKQKLAKAGLFDKQYKKPLPRFPTTIGIISSATGAAVRDVLSILERRYRSGRVIIYPIPVQGKDAARQIANMINIAGQHGQCDVLILTRGGGSLEDLWAFNEEVVAHAIFACNTPLICGVGHEIDFTIADFVADQRAATPSVAAELVSPDTDKVLLQLQRFLQRLLRSQQQYILQYRQRILLLTEQLVHPQQKIQQQAQQVDACLLRLQHQLEKKITANRALLATLLAALNQHQPIEKIKYHQQSLAYMQAKLQQAIAVFFSKLSYKLSKLNQVLTVASPYKTLERGYAIITDSQDKLVKNADHLRVGDGVRINLTNARLAATVDAIDKK